MAEVAASVALVEAGAPAATAAPAAKTVEFSDGRTVNFADSDTGTDRAATILDEVLAGEPATETSEEVTPTDKPEAKPEAKPAEKPAAEPTPEVPNDLEAAKLRKGFAKLAEERQRLVELQNTARSERAAAQQYAEKARRHDELVASIEKDPAGFLLAHGGETLVQKALQGFIDQEKSPAEREIAKVRQELADRDAKAEQARQEQVAANWRNGIVEKVKADERFDLVNTLGLHGDVIQVITGYYEKHSRRDDKGNVVEPAILSWDTAAQAVEENRAAMLEGSKRYGKRAPVTTEAKAPEKKDAPPAKQASAPAKKAPTSLSSVPVADTPHVEADLSVDPDERQAQILAEMGL